MSSVVLQINSELPQPSLRGSTQGTKEEADLDDGAQVDRQMTAVFRAFAGD